YLKTIPIPRAVRATAIPISILGTLILVRHRTPADFSNWSPSFDLAIGSESSGYAPWRGTVSRIAIYPCALEGSQVEAFALGISPLNRASGAGEACGPTPLLELYPSADSQVRYGHPLVSKQEELRLYDALTSRSKLTLLVWMQSGSLTQR